MQDVFLEPTAKKADTGTFLGVDLGRGDETIHRI